FVKPDVVSPGNRIASLRVPGSTLDVNYPGNRVDPSVYGGVPNSPAKYYSMSGTSMAAPVVSAGAALMLQQSPSLTPDQLKARMMKTSTKSFPTFSIATDPDTGAVFTSYYDIFTVGAGYIDLVAALNNTDL